MSTRPEDFQRDALFALQNAMAQGQNASPYEQALAEFTAVPRGPQDFLRAGTDLADIALSVFTGGAQREEDPFFGFPSRIAQQALDIARPEERFEYVESATGKLLYKSGVIVDLVNGGAPIFQDPNDPTIQGSPAWLRRVQETWDENKVGVWRKRLANQGYEIESKGGISQPFLNALRDYHWNRYFNYGKAVPVADRPTFKEEARAVYTRHDAENDARATYIEVFGDDPRPEEVKRFADGYLGAVTKALRKGVSPERAAQRGEQAVIENVAQDPGVQKFLELEETDTALHDSFVNMFQVFRQLGEG